MPSMYDHIELVGALIVISMLLSLVEVVAYARLSLAYLRRIARPFAPSPPLPTIAIDRLEPPAKHGELVFARRERALVVRRSLVGRRAGAWALVEIGEDGAARVAWAAYPTLGWLPLTIAFASFGGLTFGGGSWLAALGFAGLFAVVVLLNRRQSRAAFEQLLWPELARLLGVA